MNKKAIELSVNFIVMFVLAIVLFGVGIKFVTDIFLKAEEYQATIDQQTQSEIERIIDPNTPVGMPINSIDLGRGENGIVGIGILNLRGSSGKFTVAVECDAAVDYSGNVICDDSFGSGQACTDCDAWAFEPEEMYLDNNEKGVGGIFISVPKDAVSGTYIYNVQAQVDVGGAPQNYQALKKLNVNVLG